MFDNLDAGSGQPATATYRLTIPINITSNGTEDAVFDEIGEGLKYGLPNIGIGRDQQRGKLDIYTGSTNTPGIILDRYSKDNYRSEIYQADNGLAIWTGHGSTAPGERMRIRGSNGNVGINISDPSKQ